jgi:hypothetical protein
LRAGGGLCRLQEGQPDPEKEAAKVEKIKALAQDPDLYNRLIKAIGAFRHPPPSPR